MVTAETIYPSINALIQQLDPGERRKLENLILGAVESKEKRKARIAAELEKKQRYRNDSRANSRGNCRNSKPQKTKTKL